MIEAEFQALIEAHAPIREWEPTAEDLHRMFWCQPLPTWVDQQKALAMYQAMRDQTAAERLSRQGSALGLDRNATQLTDVVMGMQRINDKLMALAEGPSPSRCGRWVVQIQSAGQWYDIDETRTGSRDGALQSLARHLKVQPHLKLRVKEC